MLTYQNIWPASMWALTKPLSGTRTDFCARRTTVSSLRTNHNSERLQTGLWYICGRIIWSMHISNMEWLHWDDKLISWQHQREHWDIPRWSGRTIRCILAFAGQSRFVRSESHRPCILNWYSALATSLQRIKGIVNFVNQGSLYVASDQNTYWLSKWYRQVSHTR